MDEHGEEPVVQETNFGEVHLRALETEMRESYLDYAMSVIVARALPDIRDGLKPVHRRILYTMHENGLRHNSRHKKSANVVGGVMAKYHPHGDQAIYDSLARMAQDFSMRYPLVDGQGNFGSMDGDPPAAMRYTEAKMTALAEELLVDIDKETVEFRPNFDGNEEEPVVLPSKVPQLLMNGVVGIAVGMATNIPPHNLTELIDALLYMIDNEEVSLDDLMEFIKGPDFPTGGVVYGRESLRKAYGTGKGGVVVRSVAEIKETSHGKHNIIVNEIPYAVNKATLLEKIADLVKDKKIKGISDLRDESARGTVRIVVELKRDAYPKKVMNQLFKMTPLQTKFHYNTLALIDGLQPQVASLEVILEEYLSHRHTVVKRRTEYDLKKAEEREHVLLGLTTALDHIDEVIETIRNSESSDEARQNLIKKFELSEIQANAILSMQLRTLAGLERQKVEDELKEIKETIKELKEILSSDKNIYAVVREEFVEMKDKYGDERRTKIVETELGKFSDEQLIPNEHVVITLTKGNYIKRTPVSTYKKQRRGGKGKLGMVTKEEDIIDDLILANTHDYLLFFTNKGRVFQLRGYEVPSAGRTARGQAIVNLLQLGPDEEVKALINLSEIQNEEDRYLFFTTKKGKAKKTKLSKFENIRSSGIIAIKLKKGDELQWVALTEGDNEVIISTANGQAIRFEEGDVRPMGRTAQGVRGIRLRGDDYVVGMDVVQSNQKLLVITENGYGKLTDVSNFSTRNRGGLGMKSGVVNKKTGKITSVLSVTETHKEVLLVSSKGQVIRLALDDIPTIGRATQGVRVMKLNKSDHVSSVAIMRDPEEELADEDDEQEDGDEKEDGKDKEKDSKDKS